MLFDMLMHGKIRKSKELGEVIEYLMQNVGDPIRSTAAAKELHLNQRTVEKFLEVVQTSYMFYRVDRCDLRSDAVSPTPKYYAVDPGLRNSTLRGNDKERTMENIVYLELRRRKYKITVGRLDSKEVGLVTERNGRKAYWQVCLGHYDGDAKDNVLASLRRMKDSHPKTIILTDRSGDTVTSDGIRELGIIDFLLGEE